MRQKLNVITFGVSYFSTAVDFYKIGPGWKISLASVEELAVFPHGGIDLALHPRHLFEVAYKPFWEQEENDNLKLPL